MNIYAKYDGHKYVGASFEDFTYYCDELKSGDKIFIFRVIKEPYEERLVFWRYGPLEEDLATFLNSLDRTVQNYIFSGAGV
jgi:hypothetical protein